MYYTKHWNNIHYKCKLCNDEIWSKWEGQFISCNCGAISVDQTLHYTRLIGNIDNFIRIEIE